MPDIGAKSADVMFHTINKHLECEYFVYLEVFQL